MKRLFAALLALLALTPGLALAQGVSANPQTSVPTATGTIQGVANFVWNGSAWVAFPTPLSTSTTVGARTLVTLDVATVTTGGTAVTALTAGHRTAGGWLQNPPTATINLCINEIGTASGTTSAANTTCITPGQTYQLTPAAGAVSVITSDSAHPFSGLGLN